MTLVYHKKRKQKDKNRTKQAIMKLPDLVMLRLFSLEQPRLWEVLALADGLRCGVKESAQRKVDSKEKVKEIVYALDKECMLYGLLIKGKTMFLLLEALAKARSAVHKDRKPRDFRLPFAPKSSWIFVFFGVKTRENGFYTVLCGAKSGKSVVNQRFSPSQTCK